MRGEALSEALAEDEGERRELLDTAIQKAIAAVYAVGGDTGMVVRRSEVYQVVLDALDERVLRPALIGAITEIICGLGAVRTKVGNRRLFAAVRRHATSVADARKESMRLRGRSRGTEVITREGNAGKAGTEGKAGTLAEWERQLEKENMPAEIDPIPRPRHGGDRFERPTLITTGGGVHRQPRVTTAEIHGAAMDNAADLLAEIDLERKVLQCRAEKLSLRATGVRLGLDKMAVSRILARIQARRDK